MNKFKSRKERPKHEFTKQIVAAVLLTYFLGVAIGAVVVLDKAPDQLAAYLTFIGAPTATTVGFYCWKAKAENVSKYKGVPPEPAPTEPDTAETPQNTEEVQG
ncbi:MAG: hypothetical protein WHF31_12535 [Candidatus Dehalobacter alkaniphilus]